MQGRESKRQKRQVKCYTIRNTGKRKKVRVSEGERKEAKEIKDGYNTSL
jgi:hypothetical protein